MEAITWKNEKRKLKNERRNSMSILKLIALGLLAAIVLWYAWNMFIALCRNIGDRHNQKR